MINRIQPERCIGQNRKEGDDPGADEDRKRLRQIDQQKRRDGDDRGDLKNDGIWIERIIDQSPLVESDCQQDAADGGEQEPFESQSEGNQQRAPKETRIGD